jgi:hypothetical protein
MSIRRRIVKMKLSARIKKTLRISFIFMSLAVAFVVPGVMKCSGSVDPEGKTSTQIFS